MSIQSKFKAAFSAVAAFQTKVVLTVAYVFLTPVGFYLRFADPLRKKAKPDTQWMTRTIQPDGIGWFRRMF